MKAIYGFWLLVAALVIGPVLDYWPALFGPATSDFSNCVVAALAIAALILAFIEEDWGARVLLGLGALMIPLVTLIGLLPRLGLAPILFPLLYPLYPDLATIRLLTLGIAALALGIWDSTTWISRLLTFVLVVALVALNWGGSSAVPRVLPIVGTLAGAAAILGTMLTISDVLKKRAEGRPVS